MEGNGASLGIEEVLISTKDDEKEEKETMRGSPVSTRKDDSLVISNPLVLLVCVDKYVKDGWESSEIEGSQIDCKMLSKLFRDFYGWKVLDISRSDDGYEECTKEDIMDFFEIEAKTVLTKRKKMCARQREKNSKRKIFDGLILALIGHGSYSYFAASDDPGEKEKDTSKHKRLSMRDIAEVWNPQNAPELAGFPKIIVKATCRESEGLEILNTEVSGLCEHPNGETLSFSTSMKGVNGKGSYIIQSINKICRDQRFGREDLHSIGLRARRGIELDGVAKEWVHMEHSITKNVYFAKKE